MSLVHPTAIVDPTAELGSHVSIGPYAVIEADVVIGEATAIGAHTVIKRYTRIGRENRIAEHVVIGGDPQDYKFEPCASYVVIGDRNLVREGATIHRGSAPEHPTRVGNDCFLMAGAHVAHDCGVGDRVVIANGALIAGVVEIGDGAFVSGNVVVHQFCRIGRLAFAGGGARISQDCLPFVITEGSPARARAVNVVGLRRAGIEEGEIAALRQSFRVLRRATQLGSALEELSASPSPYVAEMVRFIRTSKRGFTHPSRS
jgi:UDP-N-acetylglucosamine acyltransferase